MSRDKKSKVNSSKILPEKYKKTYNTDYNELIGELEQENNSSIEEIKGYDSEDKSLIENAFNNNLNIVF